MSTNAKEVFNQGDCVGIASVKGVREKERKKAAEPKL